ncbi:MAG: cellulase N-terminal Ig-like domain-containing protein, partial [Stackebrandtia sp.]
MRLKIVTAAAAAAGLAVSGVYAASDAEAAEAGEAVRVNQVGYLPDGPKRATVVADQTDPLKWTLRDADGAEVAAGDTEVFGDDEPSGDHVHHVDFTDFTQPGDGYVLEVDGQASHPFDVRGDVYAELANDAWAFFYHQRAGIEIEAQYVGEAYARPAGHLGVAPNTGDLDVPCAVDCDYSLDVPHGWYDAGDQGKYVVNGGLSAWHLLNVYERSLHVDGADQFADGQWAIPENGNGVPDVLDEARWELEFLIRMQVPAGKPLAGMAHHKMHDANWTG